MTIEVELPYYECPRCHDRDQLIVVVHAWAALRQRPGEPDARDRFYEDLLDGALPGPPEWDQASWMICRGCHHGDRAAAFWVASALAR